MEKLNPKNAKFTFTEEQTKSIVYAAYHLSEAASHLKQLNGMLSMLYSAQATELLEQCGLGHTVSANTDNKSCDSGSNKPSKKKLSKQELKDIDDIYNSLSK